MKKIYFSCVVDNDPLFYIQAINLISTLLASGTAKPEEIIIHIIEGGDKEFIDFLKDIVPLQNIFEIKPINEKFPRYCNKLQQLNNGMFVNSELIVLLDTDIAFTENLRDLFISSSVVKGKVVDLPNPPLEILQKLKDTLGIKHEPKIAKTTNFVKLF